MSKFWLAWASSYGERNKEERRKKKEDEFDEKKITHVISARNARS
jgi:hypothetical protein